MNTQYLSVNYGEHRAGLSSPVYVFGRRRSSGDLKGLPASPICRQKLKKMYNSRIWKSREDIKKENDAVAYTPEELNMTQCDDERIFLEYQRCAMATRRRKSFNDAFDTTQNNITPTKWGRLRTIFNDRKLKEPSFSETDSACDDDAGPCSINDLSPPGTPSGKSSPLLCVSSKVKSEGEDEYGVGSTFPTSWNRIKKIFKDKARDEPVGHSMGPSVEIHLPRRGSCDSQLSLLRVRKTSDKFGIPDAQFQSSDELDDLGESQIMTNNGGWSRFKNKFKDGKSKLPASQEVGSPPNDAKRRYHDATLSYKKDSSTHKKSGNASAKSRKYATHHYGENALHHAVLENDLSAVKKIIHSGQIDINYLKPPGLSALQVACAFGNMKIIEQLILNGADVQLRTWSALSPLQIAALFGHFEVCQYLILSGANSIDVQNGFVHDLKLMSTVLVR